MSPPRKKRRKEAEDDKPTQEVRYAFGVDADHDFVSTTTLPRVRSSVPAPADMPRDPRRPESSQQQEDYADFLFGRQADSLATQYISARRRLLTPDNKILPVLKKTTLNLSLAHSVLDNNFIPRDGHVKVLLRHVVRLGRRMLSPGQVYRVRQERFLKKRGHVPIQMRVGVSGTDGDTGDEIVHVPTGACVRYEVDMPVDLLNLTLRDSQHYRPATCALMQMRMQVWVHMDRADLAADCYHAIDPSLRVRRVLRPETVSSAVLSAETCDGRRLLLHEAMQVPCSADAVVYADYERTLVEDTNLQQAVAASQSVFAQLLLMQKGSALPTVRSCLERLRRQLQRVQDLVQQRVRQLQQQQEDRALAMQLNAKLDAARHKIVKSNIVVQLAYLRSLPGCAPDTRIVFKRHTIVEDLKPLFKKFFKRNMRDFMERLSAIFTEYEESASLDQRLLLTALGFVNVSPDGTAAHVDASQDLTALTAALRRHVVDSGVDVSSIDVVRHFDAFVPLSSDTVSISTSDAATNTDTNTDGSNFVTVTQMHRDLHLIPSVALHLNLTALLSPTRAPLWRAADPRAYLPVKDGDTTRLYFFVPLALRRVPCWVTLLRILGMRPVGDVTGINSGGAFLRHRCDVQSVQRLLAILLHEATSDINDKIRAYLLRKLDGLRGRASVPAQRAYFNEHRLSFEPTLSSSYQQQQQQCSTQVRTLHRRLVQQLQRELLLEHSSAQLLQVPHPQLRLLRRDALRVLGSDSAFRQLEATEWPVRYQMRASEATPQSQARLRKVQERLRDVGVFVTPRTASAKQQQQQDMQEQQALLQSMVRKVSPLRAVLPVLDSRAVDGAVDLTRVTWQGRISLLKVARDTTRFESRVRTLQQRAMLQLAASQVNNRSPRKQSRSLAVALLRRACQLERRLERSAQATAPTTRRIMKRVRVTRRGTTTTAQTKQQQSELVTSLPSVSASSTLESALLLLARAQVALHAHIDADLVAALTALRRLCARKGQGHRRPNEQQQQDEATRLALWLCAELKLFPTADSTGSNGDFEARLFKLQKDSRRFVRDVVVQSADSLQWAQAMHWQPNLNAHTHSHTNTDTDTDTDAGEQALRLLIPQATTLDSTEARVRSAVAKVADSVHKLGSVCGAPSDTDSSNSTNSSASARNSEAADVESLEDEDRTVSRSNDSVSVAETSMCSDWDSDGDWADDV
ncbi:MAG: hypothetical protein MHM6MM_000596 [Cercozoa sp. M6MM]